MTSGCYVDAYAVVAKAGFADDSDGDDDYGDDSQGYEPTPGEVLLDVPAGDPYIPAPGVCRPDAHLDAALPCDAAPPTTTIEPEIAWQWFGSETETSVLVTPLVANLSDDNGDGSVDLCDRPDIAVIAVDLPDDPSQDIPAGHIYLLDSETGVVRARFDHLVDAQTTPVIADLDGDDVPELVALERSADVIGVPGSYRAVAFDSRGDLLWTSDNWSTASGSLSVVDLDHDGSPEVLTPDAVLTAEGQLAWAPVDAPNNLSLPVAVDLDGDPNGDIEVIFGRNIYDHTGALLFALDVPGQQNIGVAAVANFDDDDQPEIYIHGLQHRVFEHDGTPKATCGAGAFARPATLADIDGDGSVEIIAQLGNSLRALEVGQSCMPITTLSLAVGATANSTSFDLDDDGQPETIVIGDGRISFLDKDWHEFATLPHQASTRSLATPVVVDADNDGAAEIIVAGSGSLANAQATSVRAPAVELIQNTDDRFAPSRRIWNQHAYFVTNIREDGHVPTEQAPHWLAGANSFRVNRGLSYDDAVCQPALPSFP